MKIYISRKILYVLTIIALMCYSSVKAQPPRKVISSHENGQIASILYYDTNENPVGIWTFYYDNGQIEKIGEVEKGTFGKPILYIGEWLSYYKNSQLKAKGSYEVGYKRGLWKYFHENGNLQASGAYGGTGRIGLGEEQQGEWKIYHENGTLEFVGSFRDGKQTGDWKEYYENGILSVTARYEINSNKESVLDGEVILYDDKGKLEIVQLWKMGKLVSSELK